MEQDTAILVGVITAVFAGVAMLLRLLLPHLARRKADSERPKAPETTTIANPPTPLPADGSGGYPVVTVGPAPWSAFSETLADVKQKVESIHPENFATREDMAALSSAMSDQVEELEGKVEEHAKETRGHLTSLERAIGRLEGKLDK